MPSPFPGMDPYLENPATWRDFHATMITYIREALQPHLLPNYRARIEERIQIHASRRGFYPDVTIIRPPQPQHSRSDGGVAVLDEPYLVKWFEEDWWEPYIEIVHHQSGEVTTVIELLSPTNKQGEGHKKYVNKQQALLTTQANLVEIDLLAEGEHTVAVPKEEVDDLSDCRYIVSVMRSGVWQSAEMYPFPLHRRLPRCRIPLRAPDPDVGLDLPAVFTKVYDISGAAYEIDYQQPPKTTLNSEEAIYVDTLLREKGLRVTES